MVETIGTTGIESRDAKQFDAQLIGEYCQQFSAEVSFCSDSAWNGDRLFWTGRWYAPDEEEFAFLRLQYFSRQKEVWIGSVQIHPDRRLQGHGTEIVKSLERVCAARSVKLIRLYCRRGAAGFWKRLGYSSEEDPRFMRKFF